MEVMNISLRKESFKKDRKFEETQLVCVKPNYLNLSSLILILKKVEMKESINSYCQ